MKNLFSGCLALQNIANFTASCMNLIELWISPSIVRSFQQLQRNVVVKKFHTEIPIVGFVLGKNFGRPRYLLGKVKDFPVNFWKEVAEQKKGNKLGKLGIMGSIIIAY